MKRTPLARGAGPRRTGRLRRTAWIPRQRRRTGFDRVTKALIRDRDGVCQGCGRTPAAARAAGLRLEVNHRWAAGRGGPDTAANGVLLCGLGNHNIPGACHGRVDHDRAWALNHGLALHTGIDPTLAPVIDWRGARWLYDVHGQRRAA